MSTIPFLPHCPQNASRNDLPPVLLPPLFPIFHQLFINAKVELGITQVIPKIQKNMCHRFIVVLKCRDKCSLFSPSCSHKSHLEQIWKPLFCSLTWVRQAFVITNQTEWHLHRDIHFPELFQRTILLYRTSKVCWNFIIFTHIYTQVKDIGFSSTIALRYIHH